MWPKEERQRQYQAKMPEEGKDKSVWEEGRERGRREGGRERRGERGLEKRFLRRILEGTKRKETAHEERGRGGKGGRDWPGTVVVD